MKIDTHQHFWKLDRGDYDWLTPDLAPLYRDFLPADLEPLLRENEVVGTILVQAAATVAETEFMLSLADRHDWILGVVGWVDFDSPKAPATIARLCKHPKLVGLRPMIQDIPDDDWMLRDTLRPAINAMITHDLTFDALVMPRHLRSFDLFLTRYPDLRAVVNHGAKPEIRNDGFEPWATDLRTIAGHNNVFCKISGLATEAGASAKPGDLSRYIAHIADVFHPSRMLFGSDWPVMTLATGYTDWVSLISELQNGPLLESPLCVMADNTKSAYPRLTQR